MIILGFYIYKHIRKTTFIKQNYMVWATVDNDLIH